jgi:hypothetical protein
VSVIDPADVLALLEDGPQALTALAGWLKAPDVVTDGVLQALRAQGAVKRVSDDRWALASDATPAAGPLARSREPELEVFWRPHRDAPSLTGPAGGLGSTLSGHDFKVQR